MAAHNDDIMVSLLALKTRYHDAEGLMTAKNSFCVNQLRCVLRDINVEFDRLKCLSVDIEENETMPGSTSHKVDIVKRNGNLQTRIESWIRDVEMPGSVCVKDVMSHAEAEVSVPVWTVRDEISDCGSVDECSASRSSRASNLKASRTKVRLARLALKHEEERQREATREKLRQLEMAEAELEACEAKSSYSASVKSVKASYSPNQHALYSPVTCGNYAVGVGNDRGNIGSASTPVLVSRDTAVQFKGQEPTHGRGVQFAPGCARFSDTYSYPSRQHLQPPQSHVPLYSPDRQLDQTRPGCAGEASDRFLPKPSIDPFDGDPLDYWAFVARYDVHIARRVSSADLRLAYLLQHCTKQVHDKVKHHGCGTDKIQACEAVWRELYERYGQPHIISRCCEQRLAAVPKITQCDGDGLENLAVSHIFEGSCWTFDNRFCWVYCKYCK